LLRNKQCQDRSQREAPSKVLKIAGDNNLSDYSAMTLCDIVNHYFSAPDHNLINQALYYIGITPSLAFINTAINRNNEDGNRIHLDSLKRRKLLAAIHSEIQTAAIRLTSRIWGMRTRNIMNSVEKGYQRSRIGDQ
jgi:hypothetical protein